jgi:hypothetical protein
MVKPRVFISHSATGDEETLALIRDLSEVLKDDFAVRVDKEHLKLGESWRSTINTWLGGCHVAVVLLTPKALESKYVAYEVSVLTFRPDALVIPIFLYGVNDAALREKGLSATNIQEAHGIVGQNKSEEERKQLVARVKEGLQPVKDGMRELTPIDRQAMHLEKILSELTPELAKYYLSKLGPEQDTWELEDNPRRSLAIKLLSRGIEGQPKVTPVLDEMSDDLDIKAVCDIFELMATSWVDLRAVKCITAAAQGEQALRAIAMNGDEFTVAAMYVLRASGRSLKGRWHVVQSHGVIEEPVKDDKGEKNAADDGRKVRVGADERCREDADGATRGRATGQSGGRAQKLR